MSPWTTLAALVLLAPLAGAEEPMPSLVRGQPEIHAASGGLEAALHALPRGPRWAGYAIAPARARFVCCGQRVGAEAERAITEAIRSDPETDVKRKAVFALSQLPKDEGVPLLIRTARENRNPEVRKQAMFWLGQSEDPRAVEFFGQVLMAK